MGRCELCVQRAEQDIRRAFPGYLLCGRGAISPHLYQGQFWEVDPVLEGQKLSVWRFLQEGIMLA
jgi:hypothetical protein